MPEDSGLLKYMEDNTMTIRTLVEAIDTGYCTRFQICTGNFPPVNLFVDWNNMQDPDLNVFDRLADLTINRWMVTPDGVIRIGSQQPISQNVIEFIEEVL